MSDKEGCLVACATLLLGGLAALAMFCTGWNASSAEWQKKCVKQGVAEFQVDEAGNTTWRWKAPMTRSELRAVLQDFRDERN